MHSSFGKSMSALSPWAGIVSVEKDGQYDALPVQRFPDSVYLQVILPMAFQYISTFVAHAFSSCKYGQYDT
jgi:hypothetical protein